MKAPLTVADVLDRAADLIEPEGAWTQGSYALGKSGREVRTFRAAVCFCAVGAIDAADGQAVLGEEVNWEAIRMFSKAATGDYFGNAATWNDHPERTKDEVVAALRSAAEAARGDAA